MGATFIYSLEFIRKYLWKLHPSSHIHWREEAREDVKRKPQRLLLYITTSIECCRGLIAYMIPLNAVPHSARPVIVHIHKVCDGGSAFIVIPVVVVVGGGGDVVVMLVIVFWWLRWFCFCVFSLLFLFVYVYFSGDELDNKQYPVSDEAQQITGQSM